MMKAVVSRNQAVEMFPHLAYTHEDTKFLGFRNWNEVKSATEIVTIYQEPEGEKRRIDALYMPGIGVVSWSDTPAIRG